MSYLNRVLMIGVVVLLSLIPRPPVHAGDVDQPTAAPHQRVTTDPPPLRQLLNSDAAVQAWFDRFLATEPPLGSPDHDTWTQRAYSYAFLNRDYARCETYARSLLDKRPNDWALHDDLSLALGKQGRYQAALDEATTSLSLPDADALHLKAIMASWMYHLGRHDEARSLFDSLTVPAESSQQWAMYQGCRACFSASSHDIPALKESIAIAMRLGGSTARFIMRDVIFDQYRHLDWFRAMVGDTLAPVL